MSVDRRHFLKSGALLSGAVGLGMVPRLAGATGATGPLAARDIPRASAPLRILILGGTGFIGPAQVEYALARGHTVTLFNRGRTNPGLFPSVEKLQGDRNAPDGYASLKGNREWDVVIDNPTTYPHWVRGAADALAGRTKHYIFVSTISVFSDRPGLIVGPGDLSDRFSYWPVRINRGGEILAPGTPDDPTQYVDARDLGEWMIRLAEQRTIGTFNATGPSTPTTMAELLYGIKAVTTSNARFTWVNADFLQAQQVAGWSEMPVWLPPRGRTAVLKAWHAQAG